MWKAMTASEIRERFLNGGHLNKEEALALYADKNNWQTEVSQPSGCNWWIWKGPIICAYEIAENTLNNEEYLMTKPEWEGAGRIGKRLGDDVTIDGMSWTPILFSNEEDPTFHKSHSLYPIVKTGFKV